VHRKRSQVAVVDQAGEVLANRNVPNGVEPILGVIGDLPVGTPAAFEAAFGWGWLVELLEDYGFEPHLVHPSQCKAIASARLTNDRVDAHILAQLLRADLLPEAWIAPPAIRQLRARLRHRIGLVRLRTLLRNRIHAVLADHGQDRAEGCWSGPGREWLAGLQLPVASREVIEDCLALIDALQAPIDRFDVEVRAHAKADPRVQVLTGLPGVGPLTALVILAEIGDIARFGSARKLAAWAGLTPTVRGSDRTIRHGHIWKAGLHLAALDPRRGGADRQTFTRVRRHLPGHRPPPREEDRHHRGRPQAAHPRLPPAHRRRHRRRGHTAADTARSTTGTPQPDKARSPTGRITTPRASSQSRMSRPRRARLPD
jgi:transposase